MAKAPRKGWETDYTDRHGVHRDSWANTHDAHTAAKRISKAERAYVYVTHNGHIDAVYKNGKRDDYEPPRHGRA